MDGKNWLIIVLIIVVVGLGSYIGFTKYQQKLLAEKQIIYNQGLSDGQLIEQRNILLNLQSNGFYSISFYDENNETQTIRLGLIQQSQQNSQNNLAGSVGLIGR